MEIKIYGVDDTDIEQKIWAWRNENPKFKITKRHPIERLSVEMSAMRPGEKMEVKNRVSVLVEYDEA
jgi:hypothetical protein